MDGLFAGGRVGLVLAALTTAGAADKVLSTELTIDPAGRRTVTVQYHPANLVNSVLLSKRTELEQKSSQKSMLHEFDSSSSVDQSWFDSE